MTFQEIQEKLKKCELALNSIKDGSYSNGKYTQEEALEKFTTIKESLEKKLNLLKEEEGESMFVSTKGGDTKLVKMSQRAAMDAKKDPTITGITTTKGKDLKEDDLSDEEQEEITTETSHTEVVAKEVHKALIDALQETGHEVSEDNLSSLNPETFTITVRFKDNTQSDYSFEFVAGEVKLDGNIIVTTNKKGVTPILNKTIAKDNLVKYFKNLSEKKGKDLDGDGDINSVDYMIARDRAIKANMKEQESEPVVDKKGKYTGVRRLKLSDKDKATLKKIEALLSKEKNEVVQEAYKPKHFDICPGAEALRDELLKGGKTEEELSKWTELNDQLFALEKKVLKDKEAEDSDVKQAESLRNQIIKLSGKLGIAAAKVGYLKGHVDKIKDISNYSEMTEASKEEEEEFHKKLDTLVHKTFGKRKEELEEAPEGMYYIKVPKRDKGLQNAVQNTIETFYHPVRFADIVDDDGAGNVIMYIHKNDFDPGMIDDLAGDGVDIEGMTNLPVHNKESMKETIQVGHPDNEPGMLKQDAYDIAHYAVKLYKLLKYYDSLEDQVDFPHWWQSKVVKAREYISKAAHYLEFKTNEPAIDSHVDALQEGRDLTDIKKDIEAVKKAAKEINKLPQDDPKRKAFIEKVKKLNQEKKDYEKDLHNKVKKTGAGQELDTSINELSGDQRDALIELQNILDDLAQKGEEAREIIRQSFPNMLSKADAYGAFNFGSSANRYDTTLESIIEEIEEYYGEEEDLDEIGMFHDPIGYRKSKPETSVFTKKYVGKDAYDILKNGKKLLTFFGSEGEANAYINKRNRELKEQLNEFTDKSFKGSELIDKANSNAPDMFGKQIFADLLPKGVASENDAFEALRAHDKSGLKQRMGPQFAPMFVHVQYHELEHEGESYRLHQRQFYNSNFQDKDPNFNPKVTEITLIKIVEKGDRQRGTDKTENLGTILVKTDVYTQDLHQLRRSGKLGQQHMEEVLKEEATNIYNKGGEIKALEENLDPKSQIKFFNSLKVGDKVKYNSVEKNGIKKGDEVVVDSIKSTSTFDKIITVKKGNKKVIVKATNGLKSLNENKATCCGRCGRVHVKGTKCKRPFLTGKDHCRNN